MLNISKKSRIKSVIEKQKRLAAKTIIDEYDKIDEWIAQELHDNIGPPLYLYKPHGSYELFSNNDSRF